MKTSADNQKEGSIAELTKAFPKMQSQFPRLKKDRKAHHGNYADLTQVVEKSKPILKENGFAITQLPGSYGGDDYLETVLMHVSGEWISSSMRLLVTKKDPQGQGSAITYARRYAWMAILGMVADDDDDDGDSSRLISTADRRFLYGLARQHQKVKDEAAFEVVIRGLMNKGSDQLLASELDDVKEQIKTGEISE